ncbi:hypothetical protein SUGI_0908040 [Cryptomeria japonica]|nr:hypothetical protein SUGI_0908040 [Cryptomeria japonica]
MSPVMQVIGMAKTLFSYRELKIATKGFAEVEVLGSGGFGRVYRGVLPASGQEIAVKCVNKEVREGIKEFVAEITSMGRLQHRNLVQLRGWCRNKKRLFIVYDYMPNGSLDKMIFEKNTFLNWARTLGQHMWWALSDTLHQSFSTQWTQGYEILEGEADLPVLNMPSFNSSILGSTPKSGFFTGTSYGSSNPNSMTSQDNLFSSTNSRRQQEMKSLL